MSYGFNGKESDYIPSLKDELESHGIQIYDTNDFEKKDNNISVLHKLQIYPNFEMKFDNTSTFHDSINICDILIAFMIDNYPHVGYEVGYAMSKDKKVLIVKSDSSDTSFYLDMVPTILWRNYSETSCDILNFIDNC